MSILNYVKTSKCPVCGCNIVISETIDTEIGQERVLEHCHGGRWETRNFICGMTIKYIPNFSREQYDEMSCKNNPKFVELKLRKTKMYEDTETFINGLIQDDNFREVLLDRIRYAKFSL